MIRLVAALLLLAGPAAAQRAMGPNDISTALGFAPYSAANPSGYQTSSQVSSAITGAIGVGVGQAFGPVINWNGTGIPGVRVNTGLVLGRQSAGPGDTFDVTFQRDANYSGGTAGFVNSAVRFQTYARAGTRSNENGSVSVLENYATAADGSENVAHVSLTNNYGTGKAWGGLSELNDFSGADPTTAKVGHEVDIYANGTDANGNRAVVGVVVGKRDPAGAIAQVGAGIRLDNSGEGAAGSYFVTGYGVGNATQAVPVQYAFDALHAVAPTGSAQPVTALRMAAGQVIDLKGDGTALLSYDPATSRLVYSYGGVRLVSWDNAGNMIVKGAITQFGSP